MLSHQKLQNALIDMKEITRKEFALFNSKGRKLAYTVDPLDELEAVAVAFANSVADQQRYQDYLFLKILVENDPEFILMVQGADESTRVLGQMAAYQIRNLVESMEEQFDRNNFIRNVLLGNLLVSDIYSKARKLHIENAPRVVFVVDTGNKDNDVAMELVKNLSDLRTGDFVTDLDEHSVVLVKDVSHIMEKELEEELQNMAASLVDNLHMEAMIKVRVGYGNVAGQITEIAQSYQEARMALEVGHVFYMECDTISYGKLGIGRLIYQLPMSLCDMYIREVFGDTVPEILDDEEAMSTIAKFFENNLNISETARQLYVHRNTLVYI